MLVRQTSLVYFTGTYVASWDWHWLECTATLLQVRHHGASLAFKQLGLRGENFDSMEQFQGCLYSFVDIERASYVPVVTASVKAQELRWYGLSIFDIALALLSG